jgi:hypothetical protein
VIEFGSGKLELGSGNAEVGIGNTEVGNMKENGSWNDSIADFGLKEYGAVKSKKRFYLIKRNKNCVKVKGTL